MTIIVSDEMIVLSVVHVTYFSRVLVQWRVLQIDDERLPRCCVIRSADASQMAQVAQIAFQRVNDVTHIVLSGHRLKETPRIGSPVCVDPHCNDSTGMNESSWWRCTKRNHVHWRGPPYRSWPLRPMGKYLTRTSGGCHSRIWSTWLVWRHCNDCGNRSLKNNWPDLAFQFIFCSLVQSGCVCIYM